jgi:hypothetical protein
MKLKSLLFLAVAVAFALIAPRSAEARSDVSFDFFYDSLSPYGEWIEVGDYGSCWKPSGVDSDWAPYADGYWSYTDGGWTWVSYEEFGGVVYHYGRWVQVEDEGWCWVPDYEWAPAWVSWRSNDEYVGWAPLPPEARWRRETGFSVWVDTQFDIGPARFNFCRTRDFGAPYLRPVICNRFDNVAIIGRTVNVTNISYYDGGGYGGLVHCGGPRFETVNRFAERPIPALKLVRNTNITNINVKQVNVFNSVQRGNQLAVFAPRVAAPSADVVRPKAVRTIAASKVNRGWAGVRDPEVANEIRGKMRQDSRGLTPESAPARRVQAAELKVLPAKADPNAPSPVRNAKQRVAPVPTDKPLAGSEKPGTVESIDPRTAEKMAREKGRGRGDENPAGRGTPPVVEQRKTESPEKPVVTQSPVTNPGAPIENPRDRKSGRTVAPGTVNPPPAEKRITAEPVERTPMVKPPGKTDDDAKSRNAAREKAVVEQQQRERNVLMERQRATQDAAQKQQAQQEAAKKHQIQQDTEHRQLENSRRDQSDKARRQQSDDGARMKQNDDARRQEAAQAAARQREVESARQQQNLENARRQQLDGARKQQESQAAKQQKMESSRRQQDAPVVKQQQVDSARAQQAAQAARQQQSDNARREQASQAARQQQAEAARKQVDNARREQAVQTARQQQVQRQAPAQVQRQAPVQAQRQAPAQSNGKGKKDSEESAEEQKKRGR